MATTPIAQQVLEELSPTTGNEPLFFGGKPKEFQTPTVVSSAKGADILSDKTNQLDKIAPPPPPTVDEKGKPLPPPEIPKIGEQAKSTNEITLTNPEDGREVTIGDPALNRQAVENLIRSGFTMTGGTGNIPSFITPNEDGTTTIAEPTREEELQKELDTAKENLFNIDPDKDPRFQAIANTISSQWDTRIRQMEQINKSRQASLAQTNIRLGSRFNKLISGGLITEEERQGIERVSDLEAKKQSAIAQARAAFEGKEWTKYAKQVDLAENALERELEALSELNKETIKRNEEFAKEHRAFQVDSTVSNLVLQGIEDPNILFELINFGEDGSQLGDFTAEEINESLKNLATPDKTTKELPTDIRTYQWLQANGQLSEGDSLFDYWRAEKEAKSAKGSAQGFGGGTTGTDGVSVSDLLFVMSALPTRLKDSEADKALIKEFVNEAQTRGLNPYQMIDELIGYRIESPSAFSEGMRSYALSQNLESSQASAMARLINKGQHEQAIQLVEQVAYGKMQNQFGSQYVSEADVIFVQEKVDSINKLLGEGAFDEVGAFTGSFSKWLSKKFGRGQANKIKAQLTSLTAEMISKRAGSALTETEWEKLIAGSVPEFNESPKTWRDKLEELTTNPLQRLNAERQQFQLPTLGVEELKNRSLRIPLYSSELSLDPFGINTGETTNNNDPLGLGI